MSAREIADGLMAVIYGPRYAAWARDAIATALATARAEGFREGQERMRDAAAKCATDRSDMNPGDNSDPLGFHAGWENSAREIAAAIRALAIEEAP